MGLALGLGLGLGLVSLGLTCVGSEAISARTLSSCDTVSASSRCSSASVLRTARSKEEAERAWLG